MCKFLEIINRECEISDKIKKILKLSQNFNKNFHFLMKNLETRISKMKVISSCLEIHKKCLIDHCLLEINIIFQNYQVIKELDSSRLLFLKKKMIWSKSILLKIISRNMKNNKKLLVN